MTATTFAPGSGPLTVADLEGMPDDGRRYELVDGVLIVSPAPGTRHQTITYVLFGVLAAACPPELKVLGAPFAIHDGENVELQPDLLVGRREDFTEKDLPSAPVLAVEVLSPSTALIDLNIKKAVFERMGTPSYWVIDPREPRLTAYELRNGFYEQVCSVAADEAFDARAPFRVKVVPSNLVDEFGAAD